MNLKIKNPDGTPAAFQPFQDIRVRGAFRARRPLASGEDARKRTIVCQAALRAVREGGDVALRF